MGTIVQEYGPIYGEAVNGTVQGRPNGSVYVPLSNTIVFTPKNVSAGLKVIAVEPGKYRCSFASDALYVAESQDLASYVQQQVYSDSDCTTLLCTKNNTSGMFNLTLKMTSGILADPSIFVVGETYYCRAQLMSSTNVAVATSNVYALECVENDSE